MFALKVKHNPGKFITRRYCFEPSDIFDYCLDVNWCVVIFLFRINFPLIKYLLHVFKIDRLLH